MPRISKLHFNRGHTNVTLQVSYIRIVPRLTQILGRVNLFLFKNGVKKKLKWMKISMLVSFVDVILILSFCYKSFVSLFFSFLSKTFFSPDLSFCNFRLEAESYFHFILWNKSKNFTVPTNWLFIKKRLVNYRMVSVRYFKIILYDKW